jgi:23S rRNA pseudouridine2605 synthase
VDRETDSGPIRLQLWIARAGAASRRQAERLILAGRVTVNGRVVTELGAKAAPGDEVRLDGQLLEQEDRLVHLLLNKPAGYLSAMSDPEGRKLACDLLGPDVRERVYNVGRLDQWSAGLLMFTNDGELARALSHPSTGIEKEYVVRADGPLTEEFYSRFRAGVEVAGTRYRATRVERIDPCSARVVLIEGKNREIRRVLEYFGRRALSLTRVRMGPLVLGDLKEGEYRELTSAEVEELRALSVRRHPGGNQA